MSAASRRAPEVEPIVILPSQLAGARQLRPEQELAVALIQSAAVDAGLLPDRRRPGSERATTAEERLDARRWLCGELEDQVDFTLELATELSGISAEALGDAVRAMLDREAAAEHDVGDVDDDLGDATATG